MPPEDSAPSAVHRPVLKDEVLAGLDLKPGSVIVDGGRPEQGGTSRAIARRVAATGRVIGLDRDPMMLAMAEEATGGLPVTLVQKGPVQRHAPRARPT